MVNRWPSTGSGVTATVPVGRSGATLMNVVSTPSSSTAATADRPSSSSPTAVTNAAGWLRRRMFATTLNGAPPSRGPSGKRSHSSSPIPSTRPSAMSPIAAHYAVMGRESGGPEPPRVTFGASEAGDVLAVHAPGRVNLIGEHTDYNEGFVLPMAIDRGITITFVPTDDRRVTVTQPKTGESASFSLDAIGPRRGHWIDYIAGMAWAMTEAGIQTHGFRGSLTSDLPQGSGLSSSAALQVASALALGGRGGQTTDPAHIARVAQRAENGYLGVQSGVMDQFASAHGVDGAALLLDCRSLAYRAVPLRLDEVAVIVADSGSPRRLSTTAYNERRAQCDAAAAVIARSNPEVRTLRDVTPAMLDGSAASLDPVLARRARHVVAEDARVGEAVAAFEMGDHVRVG